MKHLTAILALLTMIFIGLACSGGDETAKANETVNTANTFVSTANENVVKASAKFDDYTTKVASIKTDNDLKSARDLAKELIPLYDAMGDNFKKAGDKFQEASNFKINDKHKEYLQTKAQEMKLRGDYSLELKKIPQSLIDSANKKEYESNYETLASKIKKMTGDAKDLADKADKIQKDNPTIIEPPKS